MNEGMPKMSAEQAEGSVDAQLEKNERMERAKATYAELLQFDEQVVDRDTHERLRELSQSLSEDLSTLSWHECVQNGLPWNPRDEMVAANENRPPAAAEVA